jgi:hypothetical protein
MTSSALKRIFFEGEVLVGAEVVDPQPLCPWFLGGGFAVEEEELALMPVRLGPPWV